MAYSHDTNLMPKEKSLVKLEFNLTKDNKTCVTYWLNKLQNLKQMIIIF